MIRHRQWMLLFLAVAALAALAGCRRGVSTVQTIELSRRVEIEKVCEQIQANSQLPKSGQYMTALVNRLVMGWPEAFVKRFYCFVFHELDKTEELRNQPAFARAKDLGEGTDWSVEVQVDPPELFESDATMAKSFITGGMFSFQKLGREALPEGERFSTTVLMIDESRRITSVEHQRSMELKNRENELKNELARLRDDWIALQPESFRKRRAQCVEEAVIDPERWAMKGMGCSEAFANDPIMDRLYTQTVRRQSVLAGYLSEGEQKALLEYRHTHDYSPECITSMDLKVASKRLTRCAPLFVEMPRGGAGEALSRKMDATRQRIEATMAEWLAVSMRYVKAIDLLEADQRFIAARVFLGAGFHAAYWDYETDLGARPADTVSTASVDPRVRVQADQILSQRVIDTAKRRAILKNAITVNFMNGGIDGVREEIKAFEDSRKSTRGANLGPSSN